MNNLLEIEQEQLKNDISPFTIGDTVKVYLKIIEGEKQRIQIVTGDVIAIKGSANRETFTVRKISSGIGVERIFPIHSPCITKVEVTRKGKVRRAKLYYLRDRKGKAARIKEKRFDYKKK